MPQFDQTSFFNQILWFSLIFLTFYIFIVLYFLPNINKTLKWSKKKVILNNNIYIKKKNENKKENNMVTNLYINFYKILYICLDNINNNNKSILFKKVVFNNKLNICNFLNLLFLNLHSNFKLKLFKNE